MTIDRWRVPKGPGTHVLMSGGILNVPDSDIHEFHQVYIDEINSGTKLYVVEQKTDRFKFFIDLDYKAPEKLSDSVLKQFCSIIHQVVSPLTRYYVARAQPRPVKDNLIKSGVHIHWPDVIVTKTQAINLRSKIIESLGEGPWEEIIDASVYGGSGLRMLWSHKKPTGDPYIPWDLPKTAETLNLMSVRVIGGNSIHAREELEINGLEEFIQKSLRGHEATHVKRVQRHEHDGWFIQTDSTFCDKIKRNHKSNHVWFSIRSGRISQRCFDDECKDFKGDPHILPPSVIDQLKDVAIVGSPPSFFIDPPRTFTESNFGAGPKQLESFFRN